MSWDLNDSKRASGRTTRMLQYAIQRVRNGLPTTVIGLNITHAQTLMRTTQSLISAEDQETEWLTQLLVTDFGSTRQSGRPFGVNAGSYNCQYTDWCMSDSEAEILIDHSVMEYKLQHIRHYLESTKHVQDVPRWLADTAMALTSLGRKVYVIAEDPRTVGAINIMLNDYPTRIAVENGSMMSNIDWFSLTLERAHPNCQLLFDPWMLRRRFAGALQTITRWDE